MNIISVLSCLRGWHYSPFDLDHPVNVPAGTEKVMIDEHGRGWFHSAMIALNQHEAEIVISYQDEWDLHVADAKPSSLRNAGMLTPNPIGFFVSVYNTISNVYCVCYFPEQPLSYNGIGKITLRADPKLDTTILNFSSVLIKIHDFDEFKKSVQELFLFAKAF